MKFKKLLISAGCVAPAIAFPIMLTSCSVYNDMLNGEYKPTYETIDPTKVTSEDEAINQFFEHGKNINNYIKSELLWTHKVASGITIDDGETGVKDLTYKSKFSTYYIYIDYAKITNASEHRISYKINTDIQEEDSYYYKEDGVKIYAGKGITHYKVSWECINLKFNAILEGLTPETNYWLIKPVNYDGKKAWTKGLEGDEQVKFNAKYVAEVYNKDDIQRYGYECTEAATMDKDRYFVSELADLLDYFCCFWSYSLKKCSL